MNSALIHYFAFHRTATPSCCRTKRFPEGDVSKDGWPRSALGSVPWKASGRVPELTPTTSCFGFRPYPKGVWLRISRYGKG
jgi:hypothetical protein